MHHRGKKTIVATLATAALVGAGCGSGDDGQQSLDELATSAGGICQQSEKRADAFADDWDFGAPRDASAAEYYIEQQRQVLLDADARLLDRTVRRLEALKPDEDARSDMKEFLGAQRDYADQSQDLADFQGRVAAERNYGARELRKRFGDAYVADVDRARDEAVRTAHKTLGGKAGKRCPPRPPSEAVFTFPTVEQAYLSRLRGLYEGTLATVRARQGALELPHTAAAHEIGAWTARRLHRLSLVPLLGQVGLRRVQGSPLLLQGDDHRRPSSTAPPAGSRSGWSTTTSTSAGVATAARST